MLNSYDRNCPAVSLRAQKFWISIDPLKIGKYERYDFEMEIFDVAETESFFRVLTGEHELQKGETHNDYYGFGTSSRAPLDAAKEQRRRFGDRVTVEVVTRLSLSPSFLNDRSEAFYRGCYPAYSVPETWMIDDERSRLRPTVREFVVWRDGQETPDAEVLKSLVSEHAAADVSGPWRKADAA